MTKTYNEIIKAIGELEMPFKEDVTKNIYDAWIAITRRGLLPNEWFQLHEYSIHDLDTLKWLIEEQIKVKEKE